MPRRTLVFLLLYASLALFSCQSYTSSLKQGVVGADDTAVISALHAIAVAQQSYSISNGGDYATLEQLVEGGLLDQRFKGGTVKDYVLTMKVDSRESARGSSYTCHADPARPSERPGRHYYIDATSAGIHVNANQPAEASDEIIR